MKSLVFVIIILLGFLAKNTNLYAQMQSNHVTNLLQTLQNTTDNSTRIRINNELSREHCEVNPREARRYAEEAFTIAKNTGDKIGETHALLHLGKAYFYLGNFAQAKGYYVSALDYCENFKLKSSEAEALRGIADSFSALSRDYYDKNDVQKAEENQKLYQIYLNKYYLIAEASPKIYASSRNISKNENLPNKEEKNIIINSNEELTKEQKNKILEELKNNEMPRNLEGMTIAERNEEIKHLRFEKQKKDSQITKLIQENAHKEETLERQNTILLGGVIALIGLVIGGLIIAIGQFISKNRIAKSQKKTITEQKNKLNKQEILVREKEENLRKKDAEIYHHHNEIDTLHIENQSVTNILKNEFVPQIHSLYTLANVTPTNMDLVKQNTFRLKNLVDTTIAVQEFAKNKPNLIVQTQNVQKIAQQATAHFEEIFKQKNLTLKNNIPAELTANFDEKGLENIFVNLFENAIKFSPENSQIILDGTFLENDIENGIQISQQDFGKSIPTNDQNLIFDKNNNVRASGWGLVYIKLMVEAQNGKVKIQSNENGNVFSFTLKA